MRSATCEDKGLPEYDEVSIHALLAECDMIELDFSKDDVVSIHALLAECDRLSDVTQMLDKWFQSTHSLRSATYST